MADAAARWPAPSGGPDAVQLARLAHDGHTTASGKTVFTTYCAACHRADGGGLIGPNLTDAYWLHGGQLVDVRRTINDGVPAKGMPQWSKMLNQDQITTVAVYVASLAGSHPVNPKPAQGDQVSTP
jgi:cytochrome c oxidase cbb3-type subunit 3